MTIEEQMKYSQRYARFNGQPQSMLGKIVTFVLGIAFLVFAFMFSLVALAIVAVGGLMLWAWVWWKTRAIREQIKEEMANGEAFSAQQTYSAQIDGEIIEGEAIRTVDDPNIPTR